MTERPQQYRFHQGDRVLPFAASEYDARLAGLRELMEVHGVDACVFTSMHNIAYYSGFLYCSFGRPYGLVVTPTQSVTISAGIDAGQPWRRCHGDNITYTDWQRDNYWRAILSVTGEGRVIGCEADHMTLVQSEKLNAFLKPKRGVDISAGTMTQRMKKSVAELEMIRHGAGVADVGGFAIREAVKEGARELDIAMAGRDAMELEIAKRFPDAEYRDTWVWFQSGINTDGAHNPVTSRKLQRLSLIHI
jgi:creatinase